MSLPKLEKMISERDAKIEFLTKKVSSMELKVSELTIIFTAEYEAHAITKESLPKLEKMISERDAQISELESQRDAEVVGRVEIEALLATKDDEIAFLTSMHEGNIKALIR